MGYVDETGNDPYAPPRAPIGQKTMGKTKARGYASFWARFAAVFIDSVILSVLGFLVGFVIGFVGAILKVDPGIIGVLSMLSGVVLSLGYYAGMTSSSRQATFGKEMMGSKVTDLKGRQISFVRALGRELAKYISAIILLIGYIMAAFTERKQALHDIIAGTLVVRVR